MTIACVEQNQSAPDNKDKGVTVALLGFETADQEKLVRAFQMERRGERRYAVVSPKDKVLGDILLVNYDNPSALEAKERALASCPQAPVVAVSRGPLQDAPAHHIRGMLIAARVLAVLDKVTAPQPDKPALPCLQTAATAPISVHAGYRVLVVDDSAAIQKSLELNLATLPRIGAIDFADNGEDALVKAEVSHYDLIFLDVMMPGIDGYETCTQLRKKPQYKKTPIIMVSGKTSPLDEVKGVMAGCTTYLTKPVQPEAFQKLGARVLAWLEKQPRP